MNAIREQAGAKINLYLEIRGRRADGYHDIRTVFVPLDSPCDTVELLRTTTPGIALTCDQAHVPDGPDNLVWRAADAFARAAAITPSWQLTLTKRIPVAAGLGGGSSDAAATLRALNRMHRYPLGQDRLHHVARGLGADVPFFLTTGPALATGVGDVLVPVPQGADLDILLVNPGFPIRAAWAYQHRTRVAAPPPPSCTALLETLAQGRPESLAPLCYNALEFAVMDKFPLLAMLREKLLETDGCLCAHLSGSGPTLFALLAPGETIPETVVTNTDGSNLWLHRTRARHTPHQRP